MGSVGVVYVVYAPRMCGIREFCVGCLVYVWFVCGVCV